MDLEIPFGEFKSDLHGSETLLRTDFPNVQK